MKKKILAAALVTLMFVVPLAGCAKDATAGSEDSSADGSSPSSTDADTEKESATSDPEDTADSGDTIKVSWAVWGDSGAVDINSDEFAKIWKEKFNVEWDLISMSFDTWDEKVRIWANSQDLPDVVQWNYKHVDAMNYAEQGLVKELPEDWQTKWPNTAAAFEGTELGSQLTETFGGTYFLPRPVFSSNKPTDVLVHHYGIYMRKDWIEAVGAEVKPHYSVEELMDVARLIKEQDPGNAGPNLVPIDNGLQDLPWVFVYPMSSYSMSSYEYYKDDQGQYQWGPASEDTLEGLKYYQQAFEEGLIHPEFFVEGARNSQENFYLAGTAGMCVGPGMAQVALRFGNNFKENFDLEPEEWLNFSFATGADGDYHSVEAPNFFGALFFSPNIEEEKFERVMDIINYSCTDQGQHEIRMGIEGLDWEVGSDGGLVNLMEDGMTAVDKYPSIRPFYHNMYILSDDFGLINPTYPEVYREMSANQYKEKDALATDESMGRIDWDVYFHDSDARRRTQFDLPEEYAALVVADGDMETKWNAWVEEKMVLVQPVLDELNGNS